MITKNDCLLLLANIQDNGVDTKSQVQELLKNNDVSLSVIKFINDNRGLELSAFYEKLRKSHNEKKSHLYKNIVKSDEIAVVDVGATLTTLSALLTQILLFSNNVEDKTLFLKHARSEEISRVLNNYFRTYDITNCNNLLRIIKADLKALESIL
jgi:hypothetical protein